MFTILQGTGISDLGREQYQKMKVQFVTFLTDPKNKPSNKYFMMIFSSVFITFLVPFIFSTAYLVIFLNSRRSALLLIQNLWSILSSFLCLALNSARDFWNGRGGEEEKTA